jgi:hypothetical protein
MLRLKSSSISLSKSSKKSAMGWLLSVSQFPSKRDTDNAKGDEEKQGEDGGGHKIGN